MFSGFCSLHSLGALQTKKSKLGKGPQKPTNVTDTSLRVKAISVPSQRLDALQSSTVRDELMQQINRLQHPHMPTRSEAIQNLRLAVQRACSNVQQPPADVIACLPVLVERCIPLLLDIDAPIQTNTIALWASLFSCMRVAMRPFWPILLVCQISLPSSLTIMINTVLMYQRTLPSQRSCADLRYLVLHCVMWTSVSSLGELFI